MLMTYITVSKLHECEIYGSHTSLQRCDAMYMGQSEELSYNAYSLGSLVSVLVRTFQV
jgi:hypothetical protein